ncbi:MAG TPA: glycosyltransferase family 9 protein [Candidatus Acidoferrales bacterium]|nr:glycosyltransferase family 9 protein [Candidatus Acidoferrales bacterium]
MESLLECLPRESRVAILRFRSLGDCVLTTPALAILKRCRPDLRVAVVVEDRFRAIFEENPGVDEILRPQLSLLRRYRPALCLNLHGGSRSAWMTAASGARYRAGFGHYRHQFVYNVRIPRAQQILGVERTVHTAEHLASAMFYLGAPVEEVGAANLVAATLRVASAEPLPIATQRVATTIIHPIAATPEKTWHAEGFLAVAGRLKSSGLEPIFIGAAGDDLSPFRAYRTISGAPLSEIKRLLSTASLFVGNDSGPAHMAAAFGLPVVVIFGASNPAIWGPWRTVSEVVTAPGGSIAQVSISQVLDALQRISMGTKKAHV